MLPPERVKPEPEIATWEMLTVAVPLFVRVRLCVALLPTDTPPKLRVVALGETTPEPGVPVFPPPAFVVYPAQLERLMIATMATAAANVTSHAR